MNRFTFLILGLYLSGCSLIEEQRTKMRTLEQKVTEISQQVETLGQTNQELEKRLTELSGETSTTSTKLTQLEQKHSSMEKMQLEIIQYQDSLKSSLLRVRRLVDELKDRIDKTKETKEAASEPATPGEKEPVATVREEEAKPSRKVEIQASPEIKAGPKGFILEDF